MVRAQALEVIMSMYESIGTASANVVYRVMKALVAGLELEFGRGAGKALAGRFLEAEEVDFRWEARVEERWLGTSDSIDDEDVELDSIVYPGWHDGKWFCATMYVAGVCWARGVRGCRQLWSQVLAPAWLRT